MAHSSPLLLRLIASSVSAATRAGKIIADVMNSGELGVVHKAANDLQTEADRSAQRCIIASLTRQFPKLTIIGEEERENGEIPSDWMVTEIDEGILSMNCPSEYARLNISDVVVWVDPLDGTSEYAKGFVDHVTVLVGIAVNGRPVGGVINQPFYNYTPGEEAVGRTIWGVVGLGVFGLTPLVPPQGSLLLVGSRSHRSPLVEKAIDAMGADEIMRVGGAGHKVLLLIEGKAHAYVHASSGSSKWDICAPEAVLTAAGGNLTDMFGAHYSYEKGAEVLNKRGVLATAKGVQHSVLVGKVPQEVLDALR